jgi:hypothetical protein
MPHKSTSASATALPDRRLFLAVGSAVAVFCGMHNADASSADAELLTSCFAALKADAEYGVACRLDEDHHDLSRLHEEWREGTARVSLIPAKTMAGVKAKASVMVAWLPHSDIQKDHLTDSLVADILAL